MRASHVWQIVSLSLAVLLTPTLVSAQQTPADKPADKSADKPSDKPSDKAKADKQKPDDPKKLEKLEDPEPPSVKIGKPEGEHKITEIRDDSGVKEVKVESGKSTYYVRPNEQVGSSLPGDTQSTTNRGAEWKVLEFDLGSKNKKKSEEDKADDADSKK
jgi:hypothetical protein